LGAGLKQYTTESNHSPQVVALSQLLKARLFFTAYFIQANGNLVKVMSKLKQGLCKNADALLQMLW
jgi:hypothetical protein